MNKKTILILCIFMIIFIPNIVNADYDAYINGTDVSFRSGPGTNNNTIMTLNINTPVSLTDKTLYSGSGCTEKWYKVNYNNQTGYICSRYVSFVSNVYTGINVVNWSARINSNNVSVRANANVNSQSKGTLTLGTNVTILDTVNGGSSSCSGGVWHKVSYYSNNIGYVCANYITKKSDITNNNITEEYKNYLNSQKFPESYHPFLNYLHLKYPNWIFVSGKNNLDFNYSTSAEEGKNYMQTTNDSYRTSSIPAEGNSWFKVNKGVISFYMDPRNWLTEERIFQFEKLDYTSSFEDQYYNLTKAIFGTGALADDKYIIPMVNAGRTNQISPVHIASRIRLEVGANGSDSTNGKEFTWKGQTYSGYYNFFNIGAYETTIDGVSYSAITRGLAHAAKLIERSGNVWNNIETAITEGSAFLANGYINKGQGTLYYQKFNVGPNANYSHFTHQYMTNIQAPAIEGNSTYNSYKNANVLNSSFIFEIPVYNNMPTYTSLPNSGNTNNNLKSLSIDGFSLSPAFDKDVLTYEVYTAQSTEKIKVSAETEVNTSSISGTGEILLSSDKNVITITVVAESGEQKNYTITVKKVKDAEKVEDVLKEAPVQTNTDSISKLKNNTTVSSLMTSLNKSGAKSIIIKDSKGNIVKDNTAIGTNFTITIETKNETKTMKISVNGDTSGDGKITILDLLQVQKTIKGTGSLNKEALLSADTSGDGKITILDLLQIQNDIKGIKKM